MVIIFARGLDNRGLSFAVNIPNVRSTLKYPVLNLFLSLCAYAQLSDQADDGTRRFLFILFTFNCEYIAYPHVYHARPL